MPRRLKRAAFGGANGFVHGRGNKDYYILNIHFVFFHRIFYDIY